MHPHIQRTPSSVPSRETRLTRNFLSPEVATSFCSDSSGHHAFRYTSIRESLLRARRVFLPAGRLHSRRSQRICHLPSPEYRSHDGSLSVVSSSQAHILVVTTEAYVRLLFKADKTQRWQGCQSIHTGANGSQENGQVSRHVYLRGCISRQISRSRYSLQFYSIFTTSA